jgi:integrase
VNLTDAKIKALQPAKPNQRYEVQDALLPGLSVRVTDKGHKTLALRVRIPGRIDPKSGRVNPVRRVLGDTGAISIEEAREKARQWLRLVEKGIDPQDEVERERRELAHQRQADRDNSFKALAEAYVRHKRRAGHRRTDATEREINRHLVSRWADLSAVEVKRRDVVAMINELVDAGRTRTAHDMFGHARAIFGWAIDQGTYDLEHSPCDRMRPSRLIGEKKFRQRVLADEELWAYWRAAGRMGYPLGPFYRVLLLTGQRLSEVAGMRRRELHPELARLLRDGEPVDWAKVPAEVKVWTVPAERFKSNSSHTVPLPDAACAELAALPQFKKGDHLFTHTYGAKPINGFGQAKGKLDRRMLWALRALARRTGNDPSAVTLEPWVQHDVRRTVRTRLSGLRVAHEVAEMVIGHGRKGLARVYDQHQFLDEMREALEAWARRLNTIVEPRPSNVVDIVVREANREQEAG